MGAIDRVSLSKDALRTANIFGHILIVSSLIVALTNYWYVPVLQSLGLGLCSVGK